MMTSKFMNLALLLLVVSCAKGFQQNEGKSTIPSSSKTNVNDKYTGRLNTASSLSDDKKLSPVNEGNHEDDTNGLIEVKEEEIPEGAMVYVLDEPIDKPTDGEILKTANNIVFRPLFRYRGKIEAQRRNSNRFRRRYFVPTRSYRHTFGYPQYYPRRYYY